MYKIIQGKTHDLKDVDEFIELINTLNNHPLSLAHSLFDQNKEINISRAPGRLDVMGGIADYSGSLVLQLPIQEATLVAAQKSTDKFIKIVSLKSNESERHNYFEMHLEDFLNNGNAVDYKAAQHYFKKNESTQWAAYIAGAFLVLMKEKEIHFEDGANILISSNVPEGKGVSSSAALEVSAMSAICKTFEINIQAQELAVLCQKVENLVVGAPCGIMDQMASVFGQKDQLMALLCQPAELQSYVPIPEEITFWGIDTGIRHSVSGSDYTSVRVGAFMGQRIISELLAENDYPNISGNYLANITPQVYEQIFKKHIPINMKGSDFIHHYQNTYDKVTSINLEVNYNICNSTAHPIYENFRVKAFAKLLKESISEDSCMNLGELMYQSHQSYSACGLGSKGTDKLVELTKRIGISKGLFGAKITGGGSGGTVAILGKQNAQHLIDKITEEYHKETGHKPYVFKNSSMGAEAFGSVVLKEIA